MSSSVQTPNVSTAKESASLPSTGGSHRDAQFFPAVAENMDKSDKSARDSFNESDVEKHFKADLDDCGSVDEDAVIPDEEDDDDDYDDDEDSDGDSATSSKKKSERCSSGDNDPDIVGCDSRQLLKMSNYEADPKREVFGDAGDQTEEFSDENKSIVWFLVKQVRPGMDLSKVVLPTFILEPRSFLDKISDYYYHADILSE